MFVLTVLAVGLQITHYSTQPRLVMIRRKGLGHGQEFRNPSPDRPGGDVLAQLFHIGRNALRRYAISRRHRSIELMGRDQEGQPAAIAFPILLTGRFFPMEPGANVAVENIAGLKYYNPKSLIPFRPFRNFETTTDGIFVWMQGSHDHCPLECGRDMSVLRAVSTEFW